MGLCASNAACAHRALAEIPMPRHHRTPPTHHHLLRRAQPHSAARPHSRVWPPQRPLRSPLRGRNGVLQATTTTHPLHIQHAACTRYREPNFTAYATTEPPLDDAHEGQIEGWTRAPYATELCKNRKVVGGALDVVERRKGAISMITTHRRAAGSSWVWAASSVILPHPFPRTPHAYAAIL